MLLVNAFLKDHSGSQYSMTVPIFKLIAISRLQTLKISLSTCTELFIEHTSVPKYIVDVVVNWNFTALTRRFTISFQLVAIQRNALAVKAAFEIEHAAAMSGQVEIGNFALPPDGQTRERKVNGNLI